MTAEEVIKVIENLSYSQGYYGRLLRDIEAMEMYEPEKFEEFKELMEVCNFKDPVDVVLFFEG